MADEFTRIQARWVKLTEQWARFSELPQNVKDKLQRDLDQLSGDTITLYVDIGELAPKLVMDAEKYAWLQKAQRTLYNYMTLVLPLPRFRQLFADEQRFRVWNRDIAGFKVKDAA